MTHVLSATGNLLGALIALVVAVIGYLTHIGLMTLLTRSLVSGIACAVLFRVLGFVAVAVLRARFVEGELADSTATTEPSRKS